MQDLEQMRTRAASQYRLAWLLTGEREASLDATLATLEAAPGPGSPFEAWMLAWSRRLVIARVLTAIRGKLAESACRTASMRVRYPDLPAGAARLPEETIAMELEAALLSIDLFPRCVLVLTLFEGISVEDAAILMDATPSLVRKGRALGLQQLTGNLSRTQVRTSVSYRPFVMTTGAQHA